MLVMSCPRISMSALQMAYDSALSSWPNSVRRALGFSSDRYSAATDSMPPVPAVGSYMVRTTPGLVSASSSSMNSRFTIRRITSRGVKCSPAVSFDSSANLRISSSNTSPILHVVHRRGVQVHAGELLGDEVSSLALCSRSTVAAKSKCSKMERTSGANPWIALAGKNWTVGR